MEILIRSSNSQFHLVHHPLAQGAKKKKEEKHAHIWRQKTFSFSSLEAITPTRLNSIRSILRPIKILDIILI